MIVQKEIVLVGEVTSENKIQESCQKLKPDLLLLDFDIIESTPIQLLKDLHNQFPKIKLLILLSHNNINVHHLLAAGVVGFMLKDEEPETLVSAIKTVMQGNIWLDKKMQKKLNQANTDEINLTPREYKLLSLIAQGLDNAQIADNLYLAEQTVRNYISRVYSKINVESRAQAVIWAKERYIDIF